MEPVPQGKIGRYVIQSELGRGAMGVVYKALDPAIGRTVAVKTIRIGQFTDEREIQHIQERLKREAQAAGSLSHTNIVTIYDIQQEEGTAFIFMEFIDGDTLEKILLSDTPIEKQLILHILKQSANALDYAHKRGIIHRDVKPANIMVCKDGTAKIADFGIARMQSHSMTQTGQILGTPNYMSPEQISGKPVDGRADQYSLAVMLYEVMTGEKPFVADSLPTLLFRVVCEAPQPALHLNPTLNPAIDAVLQRALAKSPDARFPSCAELMRALDEALESAPGWTTLAKGSSLSQPTIAAPAPHHQQPPKPVVLGQNDETVAASSAPAPTKAAAPPSKSPQPAPVPSVPIFQTPAVIAPAPKSAPIPPAPAAEPKPIPVAPTPAPVAAAPTPAPVASPAPALRTPQAAPKPVVVPNPVSRKTKPNFNRTPIIAVAVIAFLIGAAGIAAKLYFGHLSSPPATTPGAMTDVNSNPPDTAPSAQPNTPEIKQSEGKQSGLAKPTTSPVPLTTKPANSPGGAAVAFAIRTTPEGARVVIDDGKVPPCTTPCQVELPNGRHTATMMLDTYKTELRIINLPQDANLSVNLEKRKGMLEINSTPSGASITIDGAELPQKTPAIISLVVGKHTVVVSLPGKPPYSQTFEMRGEATISLQPNWAN